VAPVLQEYVSAPLAVKLTGLPGQTLTLFEIADTVGDGFTARDKEAFAVQPKIFVPITEYVVITVGETLIEGVVGPVLHV
jgi:hypothetical protein